MTHSTAGRTQLEGEDKRLSGFSGHREAEA